MDYDFKAIGNRIREERNKNKLTQEKLGAAVFVKRQTIANWENAVTYPDLNDMLRLCGVFLCELSYLLCENDCRTKDLQGVQDYTGLSEDAIKSLVEVDGTSKMRLNTLICSEVFWGSWLYRLNNVASLLALARDTLDALQYDPEDYGRIEYLRQHVTEVNQKLRLSLFDLSEANNLLVNALFSFQETALALEQKERELNKQRNRLLNLQGIFEEGEGRDYNGKEENR